jgi:hypothetical protein
VLGLLVLCLAVGCGGPAGEPASVSGSVTYAGQPLAEGSIRFFPEEGTPGAGGAGKIVDGTYSIEAGETLKSGKHSVRITAMRGTGRTVEEEPAGIEEGEEVVEGSVEVEELEQYLPAKYNSNTELSVDLAGGANTEDFQLEAN